jgi:hypothetical protein
VLVNSNYILLKLRSQVQKLHRLELAIFVRKNAIFRGDKLVLQNIHPNN